MEHLAHMNQTTSQTGYHMTGAGLSMFVWVFIWVAIITLISIMILKWLQKENTPNSAADIAKLRYAKGEISKKEFEQIMKDIDS